MWSLMLQQQKNCLWYRSGFGLFLAKDFLPRFLEVVSPLENLISDAIFRACYMLGLGWDPEAEGNHQDTAAQGSAHKLFPNSIPLEQAVWWSLPKLLLLAVTSLCCLVELHFSPVFNGYCRHILQPVVPPSLHRFSALLAVSQKFGVC